MTKQDVDQCVIVTTNKPYTLYGTPRVQAFATQNYTVEKNSTITLYGKGIDQETKDLIYTFVLPEGNVSGLAKTTQWTAPDEEGTIELQLIIEDEAKQTDTAVISIEVVSEINYAPEIIELTALKNYTSPGGTITLHAVVTDVNNDVINYDWSVTGGNIMGDEITRLDCTIGRRNYTVTLMVSGGAVEQQPTSTAC